MKNILEHFKATVHFEFNFLKNFGFDDFTEEEIAYEYHIIYSSSNNNIKIRFQIEMISSTPIWITINGIHLEKIFEHYSVFENDKTQREKLYHADFNQFIHSDNFQYLKNNQQIFLEKGFLLNENYLKEIKSLLLKNPQFLQDASIYQNLQQKINMQSKLELEKYYMPFKKMFDNNRLLIDDGYLKIQLITHILIVETDKISMEIDSYNAFKEFLAAFSEIEIHPENVIYKFEPKYI